MCAFQWKSTHPASCPTCPAPDVYGRWFFPWACVPALCVISKAHGSIHPARTYRGLGGVHPHTAWMWSVFHHKWQSTLYFNLEIQCGILIVEDYILVKLRLLNGSWLGHEIFVLCKVWIFSKKWTYLNNFYSDWLPHIGLHYKSSPGRNISCFYVNGWTKLLQTSQKHKLFLLPYMDSMD